MYQCHTKKVDTTFSSGPEKWDTGSDQSLLPVPHIFDPIKVLGNVSMNPVSNNLGDRHVYSIEEYIFK